MDTARTVETYLQDRQALPPEERLQSDRKRARDLVSSGDLLLAYDLAAAGLEDKPLDPVLLHVKGLTLAQMGHPREAEAALMLLVQEAEPDAEILSLLARIYKDRWSQTPEDDLERNQWMEKALARYREASEIEPENAFPLINLAFCAAMAGFKDELDEAALQILKTMAANDSDYFTMASIAEAHALRGDPETAEYFYKRAVSRGQRRIRDMARTRQQARWIGEHLYNDPRHFDKCFPIPDVLIFAGHMMDKPNRGEARFPPRLANMASVLFRKELVSLKPEIVCCSAAGGADIMMAQLALELGCTVHIFLPWNQEEFEETSVPRDWRERYHAVLEQATSIRLLSKERMPESSIGFDYLNQVMIGTARKIADDIGLGLTALVYWDGNPGGVGGTGSLVRHCLTYKIPVIRSFLPPPSPNKPILAKVLEPPELPPADKAKSGQPEQVVRSLLFADVVGYGALADASIPHFVKLFLGTVARIIEQSPNPPEIKNTWGDALYLVFERCSHAANFAIHLQREVAAIDWKANQLPDDLKLRVGLHAGPVFPIFDPIQARNSYTGFHVSWAARIEPKTREGAIYASEEFAALLQLEKPSGFRMIYVGRIPLAKEFWERRLYELLPG